MNKWPLPLGRSLPNLLLQWTTKHGEVALVLEKSGLCPPALRVRYLLLNNLEYSSH